MPIRKKMITKYDLFVREHMSNSIDTILTENKSQPINVYEDFVLIVQPSKKGSKARVHMFLIKDGKPVKVTTVELKREGKTDLISKKRDEDGNPVKVGKIPYYIADIPNMEIEVDGAMINLNAKKIVLTLPKDTDQIERSVIGGVKGIKVQGKKHSLAVSAVSNLDEIPATGESGIAYALFTELGKRVDPPVFRHIPPVPPVPPTPELTTGNVAFSVQAEFAQGSSDVNSTSGSGPTPAQAIKEEMKKAMSQLKAAGKDSLVIDIEAFASTEGAEDMNMRLSQQRATAAARYINSLKTGIKVRNAVGRGETTKFGSDLASNRRLVATIVK